MINSVRRKMMESECKEIPYIFVKNELLLARSERNISKPKIDMKAINEELRRKISVNTSACYIESPEVMAEISTVCKLLSKRITLSNYTYSMKFVNVTPIIAPDCMRAERHWDEKAFISLNERWSDISVACDYEAFCNSDLEHKKIMLAENVIKSLSIVKNKMTDYFDFEKLEKDIMHTVVDPPKKRGRKTKTFKE